VRQGPFTVTKCFHHGREAQEGQEHRIELVEAAKDAAQGLKPAEQPDHFVSAAIPGFAVCPRFHPDKERRNDRDKSQTKGKRAGFIALIGAIPQDPAALGPLWQRTKQLVTGRRIASLVAGQAERAGPPSSRGNPMNFGSPPGSGLADGLRTFF